MEMASTCVPYFLLYSHSLTVYHKIKSKIMNLGEADDKK